MTEKLSEFLAEIVDVLTEETGDRDLGIRAARALVSEKGGRRMYVLPAGRPNADLVEIVGDKAASVLAWYFAGSENEGVWIDIPAVIQSDYLDAQRRRKSVILKGLRDGMTIQQIAAAAHCTRRLVYYHNRRRKIDAGDTRQLRLFADDAG